MIKQKSLSLPLCASAPLRETNYEPIKMTDGIYTLANDVVYD